MANKITEEQRAQAFEMFGQGLSTNEVAKKLFKKYWNPAKKLRDEWDAAQGGAEEAADGATEPEIDMETWDVTLQLPAERMDQIMARFTPQEKANAICAVLQGRLNAEA